MRRKALADISFLLFSNLIMLLFVSSATADPIPIHQRTPNTNPPRLIIHSPSNTTYYGSDVTLNITIVVPYDWTRLEAMKEVYYEFDGIEHILPVVAQRTDNSTSFSTVLEDVAQGQHILQLTVRAQSEYFPDPNLGFPSIYSLDTSQAVIFTIKPKPFPTALVIAAVALVVVMCIGFAVHFKKATKMIKD